MENCPEFLDELESMIKGNQAEWPENVSQILKDTTIPDDLTDEEKREVIEDEFDTETLNDSNYGFESMVGGAKLG